MDCYQSELTTNTMKKVLENSGVEKKIVTKVLSEINEVNYFWGKVLYVLNSDKGRAINVGKESKFAVFNFPDNAKNFEDELIRAQNEDFTVIGSYKTANNINTLLYLIVEK